MQKDTVPCCWCTETANNQELRVVRTKTWVKKATACMPTICAVMLIHATELRASLQKIIMHSMLLTLDGGREGRLRLEERGQRRTYSRVEVLIAAELSPKRTTHLYQVTTEEETRDSVGVQGRC